MSADLSRQTQRLLYQADQLLALASEQEGSMQLASEAGALALIERGLVALIAELAAPQTIGRGDWQQLIVTLPEALQERRLLERALFEADGELHDLYCSLEQQYTERQSFAPAAQQLIATTASPNERVARLRYQLVALRRVVDALREYSRFC